VTEGRHEPGSARSEKNLEVDMSKNQSHQDGTRAPSIRRRLFAAGVLVLLTLVAGWAIGKGGPRPGDPPGFEAGSGPIHFRGQLDRGSVLEGGDGQFGMELILSADDTSAIRPLRIPTDLLVILDQSGSMAGKPLEDARSAVRELIGRLGASDRFALVTYSSAAGLAVPLQEASATNKQRWISTVDRIGANGGTNMSSGLDLAIDTIAKQRLAGRMPRMILLSDGHANEGDHSFEGLRARAQRAVVGEYVLSAVGVGQGFDEALMTALADAGTGNFYYVRDGSDLGDVFAGEFDSARETVASAVAVEIELAPGVELLDAAGYPVERVGRTARFRPGTLFAGQERRIWLSMRAPTNRVGDLSLGDFRMTYRQPAAAPGSAPEIVRIDDAVEMACVQDEKAYVASLDEGLVLRNLAEEKLSHLKQRVAASVRAGDYADAEEQIESFKQENAKPLRLLGHAPKDTDAYREADALAVEVKEAFAAPQAPAARNVLSKKLSASGQDGRRQGAKKKK
jgi:Ca-activated chloride channel family protein